MELLLEGGVEVMAILISGPSGQSVAGVSGIPVTHVGGSKPFSGNLEALEQELAGKIGRSLDKSQLKIFALGDPRRNFSAGGIQ